MKNKPTAAGEETPRWSLLRRPRPLSAPRIPKPMNPSAGGRCFTGTLSAGQRARRSLAWLACAAGEDS
jgi:hypothetical protein